MNILLDSVRFLDHSAFLQRLHIIPLSSGVQSCRWEICCADSLAFETTSHCLEACCQISSFSEFRNFIRCVSFLLSHYSCLTLYVPFQFKNLYLFQLRVFPFYIFIPMSGHLSASEAMCFASSFSWTSISVILLTFFFVFFYTYVER